MLNHFKAGTGTVLQRNLHLVTSNVWIGCFQKEIPAPLLHGHWFCATRFEKYLNVL